MKISLTWGINLGEEETFYKLVLTNIISGCIESHRLELQKELYAVAIDPILLKRRFRMLQQLADYESQIYKKIYQFQGSTIDDYMVAVRDILSEINYVTERNG